MYHTIEKLGLGATSTFATIGVSSFDWSSLGTAIVQIVIAVGTIISLFKKPSKN